MQQSFLAIRMKSADLMLHMGLGADSPLGRTTQDCMRHCATANLRGVAVGFLKK
jgi:hypothetical protein